jgi:hypothetical protein
MNVFNLFLNKLSEDNCLSDSGNLFRKQAALYLISRLPYVVLVLKIQVFFSSYVILMYLIIENRVLISNKNTW